MFALSDDEISNNVDDCDLLGLTLQEIHVSMSPIQVCCLACLFFTMLVFIVSELSQNYSQTDKL